MKNILRRFFIIFLIACSLFILLRETRKEYLNFRQTEVNEFDYQNIQNSNLSGYFKENKIEKVKFITSLRNFEKKRYYYFIQYQIAPTIIQLQDDTGYLLVYKPDLRNIEELERDYFKIKKFDHNLILYKKSGDR